MHPTLNPTAALAVCLALWLAGCAPAPLSAPLSTLPNPAGAALARGAPIAVTAHPLATQAALQMMSRGGSVADAALAAQLVLGLVEPQSSGLGGGALALHWDAATATLSSIDGLASAPALTALDVNVASDGRPVAAEATRRGGRSVGVPGALALFEQLHGRHGKLPWAALFEPATAAAEQGFAMPRYLHEVLSATAAGDLYPALRALYFSADARVLPVGTVLRNPAYAQTLRTLAERGPLAWLRGGAARNVAAAAQQGARPGLPSWITEQDLLDYRTRMREPLCGPFMQYMVCTMGPPSFGGVTVLQTLQIVQQATPPGAALNLDDPAFVHRYLEAARLAQADRQRHLGDPDYVHVPLQQMLEPLYLQLRAQRIDPQRAMAEVPAGAFAQTTAALPASMQGSIQESADATSQMAFVDAQGNALSLTTTVNLDFGSWLLVDGYVLNNAMTNFANAPAPGRAGPADQRPNRAAPGKRPITSMAPTMVFDARGLPVLVGGSAGGGPIVDYVATSLVEMLAMGRTPAQALARGHVSAAPPGAVQLEQGTPAAAQAAGLRAKGHSVTVGPMKSGLAFIQRVSTPDGERWTGAADPRRDGVALSLP